MLRITTTDSSPITTFRLEGRLVGAWVAELERCWISVKTADATRKIEVDMSDIDFVDEKGEALLECLYLNGSKLHGGNPFMELIVAHFMEHSKPRYGAKYKSASTRGDRHGL
jgi:hypothetical protein